MRIQRCRGGVHGGRMRSDQRAGPGAVAGGRWRNAAGQPTAAEALRSRACQGRAGVRHGSACAGPRAARQIPSCDAVKGRQVQEWCGPHVRLGCAVLCLY